MCSVAEGDYADFCLAGANQGRQYGATTDEKTMIEILDEKFLQERFISLYGSLENPVLKTN